MGKFIDLLENSSAGATGAGAIASVTTGLGSRKRSKKSEKEKKVPETIFAMSAEDIEDVISIRRRAGLNESSPLLATLLIALKRYGELLSAEGERAAYEAMIRDGFNKKEASYTLNMLKDLR